MNKESERDLAKQRHRLLLFSLPLSLLRSSFPTRYFSSLRVFFIKNRERERERKREKEKQGKFFGRLYIPTPMMVLTIGVEAKRIFVGIVNCRFSLSFNVYLYTYV